MLELQVPSPVGEAGSVFDALLGCQPMIAHTISYIVTLERAATVVSVTACVASYQSGQARNASSEGELPAGAGDIKTASETWA